MDPQITIKDPRCLWKSELIGVAGCMVPFTVVSVCAIAKAPFNMQDKISMCRVKEVCISILPPFFKRAKNYKVTNSIKGFLEDSKDIICILFE
jgi:hypothetical protein